MVPVLFEMEVSHCGGESRVYLHDEKHSVFDDEQEYLLAGVSFGVKEIKTKEETYDGEKM